MNKPIFNEKTKVNFIDYYLGTREVKKTSPFALFRKTAPYETVLNKDCCLFSKDEIINMYSMFNAKSLNVLLNYNTILKAYCSWMKIHKNVLTRSIYNEISQEMLKPLVLLEATVPLTRDDITNIEDKLLNWTDKAIVECLWEGVAGSSMTDLVSISQNMVDTKNKMLYFHSGKKVILTERLLFLLDKAFDESEYRCYGQMNITKTLTGDGKLYKLRDNADGYESEDKNFRWVYRKIQIYRDYVGIKKFTMKNISTSGMYYYIKEGMKENNLDLRKYLSTEIGQKLMDKYDFNSKNRIDTVVHKFKQFKI